MVKKYKYQLSTRRYDHFVSAYVKLERIEDTQPGITSICGFNVHTDSNTTVEQGRDRNEIAIDGKVLRINLVPNSLNLKIAPDLTPKFIKRSRMYHNDSSKGSILKQNKENECETPSKNVSFSNTYYITPIPPRRNSNSPSPVKDYEFAYKEYLKMNGACSTPDKKPEASPAINNNATNTNDTTNTNNNTEITEPEVKQIPTENNGIEEEEEDVYTEIEYLEEPKRRRGRPPKGTAPAVVYRPAPSPPKKRGWPLGLSRKTYISQKKYTGRRRGRPRKIVAFSFQSIVSEIKTVTLPSDLWSAHVSVTSKKSQVCFTRVVQAVSNSVPVECDRSVKFNGTVNYIVRMNNRDVDLLAAPPVVNSLRDVEILLEIVNEIGINDPILEYNNR